MWFTRISIQNPVFAAVMMVALVILGLASYARLPVEEMPDVKFPVVVIITNYPGASPEIVENEISRRIEERVFTLSGIKHVRSESYYGSSVVVAEFELNTDSEKALRDVRDKVNEARVEFKKEVKESQITQARNDDQPTISIAITSDRLSAREMTVRAEQYIQRQFQTLKGVSSAKIVGGVKRQVHIEIDPQKLRALGVGANEIVTALQNENQEVPIGSISFAKTERIVQLRGRIKDVDDFRNIVVARHANQAITIGQLANVIDGQEEDESLSHVNGHRAISIDIRKADGANTIAVTDAVKASVAKLNEELKAENINLQVVGDSSRGIRNQLTDVRETLLEGAGLTIIIVWLFLGSWRSTVITGLTLPVALIGTFSLLHVFGFTINVMTLMALSLCVGLLIDDAIVVRENIVRHTEMGKSHYQAALDGTQEIGLAVLATTLTIVAVFMPVGSMGGILGKFFVQFGIAVCGAVLISMFVSFTLDPMLSSIWADPHVHGMRHPGPLGRILDGFEKWMDKVTALYGRVIKWALGHRKSTLGIALLSLVLAFAIPATGLVGSEFIPQADVGRIYIDFRTPIGTTIDYTGVKVDQVEAALKEFKEISEVYTTVDSDSKHIANMTVKLVDKKDRRLSQKDMVKRIRARIERVAGIEVRSVNGAQGGGGDAPVTIQVQGRDFDELKRISEEIAGKLRKVPHLTDVQTSLRDAKPSIDIDINRDKAAQLGLSVGQVGSALRPLVAGDEITNWKSPEGSNYAVILNLPKSERRIADDLAALPVASRDLDPQTGQPAMIPLGEVATVKDSGTSTLIKRLDQYRNVTVTAQVDGVPVGSVQNDIDKILKGTHLPPGYHFNDEGDNQFMSESFGYALEAMLIGAVLIYLVLASQFSSFTQPIAIMVSLPLSLVGVFMALMLWRTTLNLFSIIGLVMLMGLVTKNAILLIDFVNRLRRDGWERQAALMEAGRVRLRPILMTTFAMVFGMLPLALALGEGAEERAPMAHAIIGGVITSTLLTLVVVPVVFTYLDDAVQWIGRLLGAKPANIDLPIKPVPQSTGR